MIAWLEVQPLASTYLSVITLGELEEGITLLGDTERARDLRVWLHELRASFAERMLEVDLDVSTTWGRIRAAAKRQGRTASAIDALLAATAITFDLTLVTHNSGDVAALPVKTFNPFEARS